MRDTKVDCKIWLAVALWIVSLPAAHAGTIGMTGLWGFDGYLRTYDATGTLTSQVDLFGPFDFDAGTVILVSEAPLFGLLWYSSGTLVDQGDGTYFADQTASWGASMTDWTILWEITQAGNTASVVTLDPDGDGIPGTKMTAGVFPDLSFEVNGTLTAVPLPAAVWLFGLGLAGLAGAARPRCSGSSGAGNGGLASVRKSSRV